MILLRNTPVACVVVFALIVCSAAYDNGLASLPPMGWNTWCTDDICGDAPCFTSALQLQLRTL
jgi:hypothetical protein